MSVIAVYNSYGVAPFSGHTSTAVESATSSDFDPRFRIMLKARMFRASERPNVTEGPARRALRAYPAKYRNFTHEAIQ